MKKTLLFLLLSIMLIGLASCGEGRKSYHAGLQDYRDGLYEEALRHYRLALSQGENAPGIYADMAMACLALGQEEEAKEYIAKAVSMGEKDPDVMTRAGIYYELAGDAQNALFYYAQVIPSDLSSIPQERCDACGLAADIRMRNGEYEEAIRLYNGLIRTGYHTTEHIILAGICFLKEHQFQAASQYFDLLAKRDETTPWHYLTIYRACLEAGDSDGADTYYERGYRLARTGSYGISGYAYQTIAGQADDADSVHDMNADAYIQLAVEAMDAEQYEEAEEHLEKALGIDPDNVRAYRLFYRIRILEKDPDGALQLLSRLETFKDPGVQEEVAWNRIILYEMLEDYKTANALMRSYTQDYPVSRTVRREQIFLERAD